MKPVFLCLCLSLSPLVAQASIDSSGRQGPALPAQPAAQPAPASAHTPDGAAAPRRTRMVEADPADRPVMKFSAMYRVTEPDAASKDNCLKGTGTRLKRSGGGATCTVGNGQVFVPDR